MNWLFKEEPTHYSFDDLVRDGRTQWSGVKNALAQKHLRAVKKGDHYVLNGSKMFITNGDIAEAVMVFATQDKSLRHKGVSAFIVDRGSEG